MKFLFAFFLLASQLAFAQQKPEVVFRIPEKDLIPEGIAYDPVQKEFYLGSIQKKKIVRITSDGKVSDLIPSNGSGLIEVLGMKVQNQKLWVCNNSPEYDSVERISSVHIFDLKTRKVWKRYTLKDGKRHLFNDVVITSGGVGYVTDSEGRGIYRISTNADTVETFIPPGTIAYPNGIALTPDEQKIIVCTGGGMGIISIDLQSKKIQSVAHEKFLLIGMDGLYRFNNSLIAIQNVTFPESILELKCNADFTAVEKIIPRAVNIPEFDSPTTGVIVDNYLYFIANSQLLQIIGNKGQIKKPAELKETLIMRLKMD
jgi:DNA-binding beta-propeller fold protein YncE